jgi:hypothetical protein
MEEGCCIKRNTPHLIQRVHYVYYHTPYKSTYTPTNRAMNDLHMDRTVLHPMDQEIADHITDAVMVHIGGTQPQTDHFFGEVLQAHQAKVNEFQKHITNAADRQVKELQRNAKDMHRNVLQSHNNNVSQIQRTVQQSQKNTVHEFTKAAQGFGKGAQAIHGIVNNLDTLHRNLKEMQRKQQDKIDWNRAKRVLGGQNYHGH